MAKTGEESVFLYHEPCDCGSSDGRAVYSNGTKYCFVCKDWFGGEGEAPTAPKQRKRPADLITDGTFTFLKARGISEETCRKFNYQVGTFKGSKVQIANYYRKGSVVAQHLRFADSKETGSFPWLGDGKNIELFGQQLWRNQGGKRIVITEGEIDCLSVAQAFNLKWPVVAVPGAEWATKNLGKYLEFLESFDEVVLMFDNDEPGQAAAAACAPMFTPNKAKIVQFPTGIKDANDLVKAGRIGEIPALVYEAKQYRPDGIVGMEDIISEVMKPVEWGLPWFIEELTKLTYGRRMGELYAFGAGTGIGKTDFLTQQIAFDVQVLNQKVGLVFLEQKPTETAKRVAGKIAHRQFHIPDAGWTQDELVTTCQSLTGKVQFYDSFGQTDWDVVKVQIRYMVMGLGIKLIYLDHLTAMADTASEKESLEQIMKEMAGLANELGCIIHFVSHLATPEGKSHEEGGRVMIKHFKGSRAIGFWSYFMFGMERNQQAEDEEERKTTIFRILKDRYTGRATGKTIPLIYDSDTGLLMVKPEGEPPFKDETSTKSDF